MPRLNQQKLYRIIDANFNRAKEGLRVCEDICRFILDRRGETKSLKGLRQRLTDVTISFKVSKIISARNIQGDVGKRSTRLELKRERVSDIFFANAQRVKESVRVLEEFSKLIDTKLAEKFKAIRYHMYAVEKEIAKRL